MHILGTTDMSSSLSYINGSGVQQLSSYVQSQLSGAFEKLLPVLCGLLVAGFGYAIVYLDSAAPGVSPRTPFSPPAKQRSRQNKSSMQLNYFCALAVGVIVTFFTYSHL
ncbi:uncharacterized protein Dmoj_GI20959, isoform B [Drosophila mojavensis]|uniref:Uncharacterized protein, isoform B n=1 Tax=Drosophila mojavensis TaxID=7230 RepID=A0A0Q9XLA6_DROMO|nr:uncharacterized protein Dmoj_GI20959, isoform B [Drosophila mojavensis]